MHRYFFSVKDTFINSGSSTIDGTDFKDKEQFDLDMIWQLHLTALSYQPWHPKYTPHAKASHPRQDLMREWWRLAKVVNSI